MTKKKIFKYYSKHKFGIIVLGILLLAFFLRFYEYDHRWALASDQARDAVVAREALSTFAIPALGPFSSAGNYTTGNTWYIWLIASTALFPYSIMTPWVILSAAYVAVVYFLILVGKELSGKPLGIILGVLAAVSPAQIAQSFNLTNPSLIAVLTAAMLLFMIKYVKEGRNLFLFLFALFLSSAISVHFQAVYLLFFVPLVLAVKFPQIKGILLLALGLILPFISYAVFDVTHDYYNYRGMIDYLQYGQYKIYIPNRWLTYVGMFWPNLWGNTIGGSNLFGYFSIILVSFIGIYALFKKKVTRPLFIILIWFFITFIALRFYRGERFDGYFIFLHIFILTLTAWACYFLFNINKYIGLVIIFLLLVGSFSANMNQLTNATNYTSIQASYWADLLIKKYPEEKFAIYNLKNSSPEKSIPLVLYLDQKNKNFEEGHKIGIGSMQPSERKYHNLIKENKMGFELWDLNSSSSAQLEQVGFERITPSDIYKTVAEWYK